MLSDKEWKAFESVKDMFGDVTLKDIDEQSITIYGIAMLDVIKVLTIVEKLSKEIERQKEKRENQKKELAILNAKQIEFNKLVNTVNSYKGQLKRQQKEIEELKAYKHDAELTKIACCTAQNCEVLNNCIKLERELQNADNKWEDKIKAKIEELNNKLKNADEIEAVFIIKQQQVLQSLLEKE